MAEQTRMTEDEVQVQRVYARSLYNKALETGNIATLERAKALWVNCNREDNLRKLEACYAQVKALVTPGHARGIMDVA